jgi:hypothetical protein
MVKLGVNLLEASSAKPIIESSSEFYILFNPILKPQQSHFFKAKHQLYIIKYPSILLFKSSSSPSEELYLHLLNIIILKAFK